MGLSLRPLGKKIWETITPQNETALRAGQRGIDSANQQLLSGTPRYGVLANPQFRQNFVQQNQAPRFSIPSATRTSIADTFTQPERLAQTRINIGDFKGSGLIEDFLNSPAKMAGGGVKIGQGQVKQGLGDIATGALEGPLGFVPLSRTAQAAKGASLLPRVLAGARVGSREAGRAGALYGGGQAAENEMSVPDILKQTALGYGIGRVGGAVLGGGVPLAGAGVKQVTKAIDNRIPLNEIGAVGKNVNEPKGIPIKKSDPLESLKQEARNIEATMGSPYINSLPPAQAQSKMAGFRRRLAEINKQLNANDTALNGNEPKINKVERKITETEPKLNQVEPKSTETVYKITARNQQGVSKQLRELSKKADSEGNTLLGDKLYKLADDVMYDRQYEYFGNKGYKRTLEKLVRDNTQSQPPKSTPTVGKPATKPIVKAKGGVEKAVEQVMVEDGIGREAATTKVDKMLRESLAPNQELFQEGALPRVVGKVKKDAAVQEILNKLSRTRTAANAEADLTSNIIKTAAKKEGVKLDRNFIDRYQASDLTDPAERRVGAVIKRETDRVFAQQQKINSKVEYRKNYVPQSYADDAGVVENATRQLQKQTGSAQRRAFSTYQQADQFGLHPKYQTLDQMIGANAREARQVLGNRDVIDTGLKSGLFTASPEKARGLSAIDGFYDNQGNQIFGSKKVADVINGVMQDSTTGIGKLARGTAWINRTWQDIALAGGIPGTPLNFFTFGQVVKDLTAGRGSVAKDLFYSMSDTATQRRFAEKAGFVRQMADRGVPFNVRSPLTGEGRNALSKVWGTAVNEPTFQRFMPNQYLSVAENTFNKLESKIGRKAALDRAAEITKNFYGITDQIAKGRDKLTQDAISSVFFAPRYRESILNTLFNTGKSVTTQVANPDYAMNRRLFAGLAVTAVGYELLNRQINGHSMFDNREGQELSLQIPYGEKDKKGNQSVVNVPFMPGFLSMPRSAFNALNALRKGDTTTTAKEVGRNLSMPLNVGTSIATNKDYFGSPIYVNQQVADEEGIPADSPLNVAKKTGSYLAGQASPAWVRAGIAQAQGKDPLRVAATALEAPLRFGKVMNPETTAYFETKEAARKRLNVNEKAVFDKLFPKSKNVLGEDIKDTNPQTRIEKSTLLRANQNVFTEVSKMQEELAKQGQAIDPVYTLDWDKAQNVLWARSLPPGESSETKGELLYNQPWYEDFKRKEEDYYSALEKKFGKRDDPYNYPTETPRLDALQATYYKLPKGTGQRSDFIEAHPEILQYWDARRQAVNRHRIALGLPPLKDEEGETSYSYSNRGGRYSRGGRRKSSVGSVYKYAVSPTAGGQSVKPKVSVKKGGGVKSKVARASKPSVTLKKSLV